MSFSISRLMSRRMSVCLLSTAAGLLGACAQGGGAPEAASGAALKPAELHWLNTVTFGANQASIERLRKLGRERYLEEQLKAPGTDTGELAATIGALSIAQQSGEQRLRSVRAEQQRINTLTDEDEKQKARDALNRSGNDVVLDTSRRHLLRALYSPAQLREQMTWFWMNHFSVYSGKGSVRWVLADYEDKAVRPHALGKFRDLLMATVTSPAMLEY